MNGGVDMRNMMAMAAPFIQPVEGGFKLNILTANLLFALALLFFVVFFCIRMVTNTKTATIYTLICLLAGSFYHISHMQSAGEVFSLLAGSIFAILGFACCLIACCGIVFGLSKEEKVEEYAYGKVYYGSFIFLFYLGLLLFSSSVDTGLL